MTYDTLKQEVMNVFFLFMIFEDLEGKKSPNHLMTKVFVEQPWLHSHIVPCGKFHRIGGAPPPLFLMFSMMPLKRWPQ